MGLRLVHFSDTHLGYRAYSRTLPNGLNVREADVFVAFRRALERTAELEPDLVLLSGDVFHTVRPSNFVIYQTFKELGGFRARCKAPLVVIAGNHESPRSQDTGCILRLFDAVPDVHVVDVGFRQVPLPSIETSVFCLPHRGLGELEKLDLRPDPSFRRNVLMVHGTLEGIFRSAYDGAVIPRSRILRDDWDYIALGHYHLHTKLAENAYYCGSTEYTSLNIWEETREPKGLIEYDLDDRRQIRFHTLKTREVVVLPQIDCLDLSPKEVTEAIRERLLSLPGGVEGRIIRLVLEGLRRQEYQNLDHRLIREFRSQALHLDLPVRPPTARPDPDRPGGERQSRTLETEWSDFVATTPVPAGLDRDDLRARGLKLLSEVEMDLTE